MLIADVREGFKSDENKNITIDIERKNIAMKNPTASYGVSGPGYHTAH